MSASLRKFINREPRYTLQSGDNQHMRFASDGDPKSIFSSQILDLSNSGAAFVVSRSDAPFIFDRIRIEVPLGDSDSIAWWAKVVRIQEHSTKKWFEAYSNEEEVNANERVIVAVHFEPLPTPHAARLNKQLQLKFREIEKNRKAEALKSLGAFWNHYTWQIIVYAGVITAGVFILWYLSRPSSNYDAEKGAPWGKRMWFLDSNKFEK